MSTLPASRILSQRSCEAHHRTLSRCPSWLVPVWMLFASCILNHFATGQATGQDISVQLSGRKAYVGGSLIMTVTITDASDHQIPELPEIDGCRFEQDGPPTQSTRQMIFNGVSEVTQSTTYRFAISPLRAGKFKIPEMTFFIEGKKRILEAVDFSAEKSETGDLMFVEVDSERESIFVGESLPLTLKIWLKPFRDPERKVTISISDMFNLISDKTNWGIFEQTLRATDPRRGRVDAKKVLRENGDGERSEYYLYEIPAQLYTQKAGPVAVGNVTIVCDYPTSLRESRSIFGSAFGDSRRLSIDASRPIVATAITDALTAKPIPTEGRPADYRGAIGRYRIMASTSDRTVYEGDPIQLRIGIIGDGPMELLPAPPLNSIPTLTDQFKIPDQPLAGVVQDREKVFPVTIRPNSDRVTQIPPIPLSYFDPKTETFETVYSDPIPITVMPMNSISLSQFGGTETAKSETPTNKQNSISSIDRLEINDSRQAIVNADSKFVPTAWWYAIVGPPSLWLAVVALSLTPAVANLIPLMRSTRARCKSAILRANSGSNIVSALTVWIGQRTKQKPTSSNHAIGILRTAGLRDEANELELFFDAIQHDDLRDAEARQIAQRDAIDWLERLQQRLDNKSIQLQLKTAAQASIWLAVLLIPNTLQAMQEEPPMQRLEMVFREANESYQRGQSSQNAAEKKWALSEAAEKYQWLIDQGIHNAALYMNAANTYTQLNEYPRAIVNYHRVLRLQPNHSTAHANLIQCQTALEKTRSNQTAANQPTLLSLDQQPLFESQFFPTVTRLVGRAGWFTITAIASISFWLSMIAAVILRRRPTARRRLLGWSVLPMFVLIFGAVVLRVDYVRYDSPVAVVLIDSLKLRAGDDEAFPVELTWQDSAGETVNILNRRKGWAEIRSLDGTAGWTPLSNLEMLQPQQPTPNENEFQN